MKYKIPKTFMGIPIDGAKERILAKQESQESQQPQESYATFLEGFEYIPSLNLYIAKEKELFGSNWNQCTTALHARGDRMPTISEYIAFINHLRDKDDDEARNLLDEIYTVRSPWRSEWLDAKFKVSRKKVTMNYHRFTPTGIEQRSVDLQSILMEDRQISLDEWLSDNDEGLPGENIPNGSLYYWHPRERDGRVAGFDADSGRAFLYCNGYPSYRNVSLGVRAVRRAGAPEKGENK